MEHSHPVHLHDAARGYAAPLDYVAVGGGVRFSAGESLGGEVGVLAPIAGRDRALAGISLRLSAQL